MPHGTPDWGHTGPKQTVFGLDDLGEHAVRLGSPHLFDRRGDVIWLTDFRNGREDIADYGAPPFGAVSLWAGLSKQGAFCMRLIPFAGSAVGLMKAMAFPVLCRVGLEFSFNVDVRSEFIVAEIHADNGVNELQGMLRYDQDNDRLEYQLDLVGPTWVVLATNLNLITAEGCPHTMKLVVDLTAPTPVYVRAILNEVTYTALAGVPLWPAGTSGTPYMWIAIEHEADGGGPAAIGVDNIIVTQNDP